MTVTRGKISGTRIWQNRFLDAHLDQVRFPDGSEGEQVLIRHPGAAAVVPFLSDPRGDDPQLLLIHSIATRPAATCGRSRPAGSSRARRRSTAPAASSSRRPGAPARRSSR
jgi:hypothetical protein